MYPLFETVAIIEGKAQNLALHQARYERSLQQFYGKQDVTVFQLAEIIEKHTALLAQQDTTLYRCRLDYNAHHVQTYCVPYQRKIYRTFQPVVCDDIDYDLKYAQREKLNQLLLQKGDCDEIIIIKQGLVTDCSIGNLIFKQGNQWVTPDTPLLAGTQRQKLLQENKIQTRRIYAEDLATFSEIRLINALNGL